MTLTRAVDTDFGGGGTPPEQSWFDDLAAAGYEGFITTSHTFWDGNPVPNTNANLSFQRALNAGLWIGCYARPVHLWEDGVTVLDPEIRDQLKFFTLDVEDEPTGTFPVLREYVTGVESYGLRPIIYSSKTLWDNVMGPGNESFSDVPLMDFAGDITGWPTAITDEPIEVYGGWNTPQTMRVGWQIRMLNPPTFNGEPVDDDVFTREFIFGEEPAQVEEGFVGSYSDVGWTDALTVYAAADSIPSDTYLLHVVSNSSPEITGGLDQWSLMIETEIGSGTRMSVYTYTGSDVPGETEIRFEGVHWHAAVMTTWRGYGITDFNIDGGENLSALDNPIVEVGPHHEGLVVHTAFHWDEAFIGYNSPEDYDYVFVDEGDGVSLAMVTQSVENDTDDPDTVPPVQAHVEDPEINAGRMGLASVVLTREMPREVVTPNTITVDLFAGITLTGDLTSDDNENLHVGNWSASYNA